MKRFLRLFLTVAVLVGALAMPLSASAGGDKVTLCHMPNTPDEVTITVSVNALPAHLAHGDYQGACTHEGVLTCPFDEVAIPVIGPDMVKYAIDFPAPPAGYEWNVSVLSSTGQDYLWWAQPSGFPPPPSPEYLQPIPGHPMDLGSPDYPSVWDIFVAKLNPTDPNFNHIVSCTAVLPPPAP